MKWLFQIFVRHFESQFLENQIFESTLTNPSKLSFFFCWLFFANQIFESSLNRSNQKNSNFYRTEFLFTLNIIILTVLSWILTFFHFFAFVNKNKLKHSLTNTNTPSLTHPHIHIHILSNKHPLTSIHPLKFTPMHTHTPKQTCTHTHTHKHTLTLTHTHSNTSTHWLRHVLSFHFPSSPPISLIAFYS